jgi:tetratricopeptide (TPR) repeat protein
VENERIAGATLAENLSVMFSFRYSTLDAAVHHLFGTSLEAAGVEEIGSGPRFDDRDLPDDEASYRALTVFLTYMHESFHVRHLTASPFGLLLHLLAVGRRQQAREALERWIRRRGSEGGEVHLPILTEHADDEEIADLVGSEELFHFYDAMLQERAVALTFRDAGDLLGGLWGTVQSTAERLLDVSTPFPTLEAVGLADDPVSPGLGGHAVVEGLARCNEYLLALQLGASRATLNRFSLTKHHGVYGATIAEAERTLGVGPPEVWLIVARLSDWALQAPVLSNLLGDRESVSVLELLPAWRYSLLLWRFSDNGFSWEDVLHREREVAETLFDSLGWDDPWMVATQVQTLEWPDGVAPLTRHYLNNLELGAELRLTDPQSLAYPGMTADVHRLGPLFSIFSDKLVLGTTGRLTSDPEAWKVVLSIIGDAVTDACLYDDGLSAAFWVTHRLAQLRRQDVTWPERLVAGHLDALLGPGPRHQLMADSKTVMGSTAVASASPPLRLGYDHVDRAIMLVAGVYMTDQRWNDAERCLLSALQSAEDRDDQEATIHVDLDLGNVHQEQERFDEAKERYEQALSLAKAVGDRQSEAMALTNLGNVQSKLGDSDGSVSFYDQALAILVEIDDRDLEALVRSNLGASYVDLERFDDAIACLSAALPLLHPDDVVASMQVNLSLSDAYVAVDRPDDAVASARIALSFAESVNDPDLRARSLTTLGMAQYAAGRAGEARAAWTEALTLIADGSSHAQVLRQALAQL